MRIVDNVPMPSHLAFQLRHGNFIRTGYMDLRPEFALRPVAPLLKPGVDRHRSTEDLAGYETVYYNLKRSGGNGIRVELARVEHNRMGVVTPARRPLTEVVALPASMRHARYYFRMWSVGQNRKIALLAAASRDLLDPASEKLEADPEGFCKSPASIQGWEEKHPRLKRNAAKSGTGRVWERKFLPPDAEDRTSGRFRGTAVHG